MNKQIVHHLMTITTLQTQAPSGLNLHLIEQEIGKVSHLIRNAYSDVLCL